jgi:ribonuclease D
MNLVKVVTMSEISRDALNALAIRRWEGEIFLLSRNEDLDRFAKEIIEESVVGFDTETRPAFRVGERYLPSLAQVATSRAVWIFPLQRLDCSAALSALLANAAIVKAGVSMADDLRNLKALFPFEERAVVDVGKLARRQGIKQSGVRNLAGLLLGYRIPKGGATSNWASSRLTPQQLVYAATDAWVCRELFLRLAPSEGEIGGLISHAK